MTRRRVPLSLSMLVCALAVPGAARAQTCTAPIPAGTCGASTSTTLTIGTVLQLALSSTATPLTPPSTADYDAAFVANSGPTATVKCNRSWRLQIGATAGTWTATNTQPGVAARANKPASDLQWSTGAGGPFTGLTVSSADATTGGATAGTTQSFFYRTLYDWTLDTPGSYSLTVVFTLTAP